ncbi:MAG: hypothetical protein AB7O91_04060 [Sphingomonas sp.]
MKIRVLDQIHISSVSADTLTRGDTFEVDDAEGSKMLKLHPQTLEPIAGAKKKRAPANKAAPAAANKSAGAAGDKGE